jgi:hypothetical protein
MRDRRVLQMSQITLYTWCPDMEWHTWPEGIGQPQDYMVVVWQEADPETGCRLLVAWPREPDPEIPDDAIMSPGDPVQDSESVTETETDS